VEGDALNEARENFPRIAVLSSPATPRIPRGVSASSSINSPSVATKGQGALRVGFLGRVLIEERAADFAGKLAQETGIVIPDEAKASWAAMSRLRIDSLAFYGLVRGRRSSIKTNQWRRCS
jgi:hypothetical protein